MQDDLFAAFAARDEGMERADRNANDEWKQTAEAAVLHIARMRPTFTADDVWRHLAAHTSSETHEPSALGPIFNRLRSQGIIRTTGEFRISARPERHAAPIRVWTAA
jgi:hypothetical protein